MSDQNGTSETANQLALRERHDNIRAGIGAATPMAIVPTTFLEAQSMAGALAASELVPKAYRDKPANVLLAIMSGAELGFGPLASMRSFWIDPAGTPKLGARALAALVNRSGLAEYFEPVEVTPERATWRTKKKGRPEQTRTWTIEMAKNAGLAAKDNWKNYPHRMLSARASKDLADDIYPELTMGLMIEEEESTPIGDQVFTAPAPPPEKPKSEKTKTKKTDNSNVIDADFTESKAGAGEQSQSSSIPSSQSSASTSSSKPSQNSASVASNPPPNAGSFVGEPEKKIDRPTMGAPDPGAADALAKARENVAAIDGAEKERAFVESGSDDGFGEDDDTSARPHSPIGPDATLSVEANYQKFERELAACTKETINCPVGTGIKLWVPWSKKDGAGAAFGGQMREAFSKRKQDLGA